MTPRTTAAFDADWLALREPVDHASRDRALLPLLVAASQAGRWRRVLDLASGTGSNLRYLAPRLPASQEWTLVDHDATLLARVEVPDRVRRVHKICGDLATDGIAAVADAQLVTASALLDLVSEPWMRALTEACRSAGCGVLFALTYDGRIEWDDGDAAGPDPDDDLVREAVNSHQRRDKGLGPALGPSAGSLAHVCFKEAGYRTWLRPSPWRLGPSDMAIALALVDGWEQAALEEQPARARRTARWANRRREQITAHTVVLTVGHVDILALPADLA